ncbi:MAG: hypothetical protein HY726_21685 [Candidatus Rokubacteria bacterium]|nr:hypothetical protein [Candidatus Rokubacteria bacterium]
MSGAWRIEHEGCPFLRPAMTVRLLAFPIAVYCRLPNGRVRVPSRDELIRFCTSRRSEDCPRYRLACCREPVAAGLA